MKDYTGNNGALAKTYEGHNGIDIDTPDLRQMDAGFPVVAAADGEVIGQTESLPAALAKLNDFGDIFFSKQFVEPRPLLQALEQVKDAAFCIVDLETTGGSPGGSAPEAMMCSTRIGSPRLSK